MFSYAARSYSPLGFALVRESRERNRPRKLKSVTVEQPSISYDGSKYETIIGAPCSRGPFIGFCHMFITIDHGTCNLVF